MAAKPEQRTAGGTTPPAHQLKKEKPMTPRGNMGATSAQPGPAPRSAVGAMLPSSAVRIVRTADELAQQHDRRERTREGWKICCPAHEDGSPSLHVRDGEKKILLKCFGGCTNEQVVEALKERGYVLAPRNPNAPDPRVDRQRAEEAAKDWQQLRIEDPNHQVKRSDLAHLRPKAGPPSAIWHYRDLEGAITSLVCRWDLPGGKKTFSPAMFVQRSNGTKEWVDCAPPVPRPPFNLYMAATKPQADIIIAEGEKAAAAGQRLFYEHVVMTSMNGSGNARYTDWSICQGRKVLIFPDWDKPGWMYAKAVADEVTKAGARLVQFALVPPGPPDAPTVRADSDRDLADLEAEGWTRQLLIKAFQKKTMTVHNALPPLPGEEGTATSTVAA